MSFIEIQSYVNYLIDKCIIGRKKMIYPKYFDEIEPIILKDDLSSFLNVFEDGIVEFNYIDLVKCAGHSCPTVAGAYLCTLYGLKELYKDEIPKRGEIKVEFKEDITQGVTGIISNVISNITGATTNNGFKGLNGKFNRCNLMFFNSSIDSNVKFTRLDTNKSVDIYYDPSKISAPTIWERAERIFQNKEEVIKTI